MGLLSKCFQRQPQSRLVPPLHDSPPARPSLHALSLVLVTRWRGVRLPLQTHRFVDFICELPPESCVGGRQTLVGVLLLNPRKQRPFSQEFGRCCDCPLLVWLLASATVPSLSPSEYSFSRALAPATRESLLAGSAATLPGKPLLNPHPSAWPTRPKRIARQMAKLTRSHKLCCVFQPPSFFESMLQWLVFAFEAQRGAPQSLYHPSDRLPRTCLQSQEG